MVLVSSDLIHSHLKEPKVEKIFGLLETDVEVQNCLRMANVMAVERRVEGGGRAHLFTRRGNRMPKCAGWSGEGGGWNRHGWRQG